jgi:hypothetical protein
MQPRLFYVKEPKSKYLTYFQLLCTFYVHTGANPTVVIYNASVVNFFNATGSLARFEIKNTLFYFEKCSSLLQRWRCSCKSKNRRIGSR